VFRTSSRLCWAKDDVTRSQRQKDILSFELCVKLRLRDWSLRISGIERWFSRTVISSEDSASLSQHLSFRGTSGSVYLVLIIFCPGESLRLMIRFVVLAWIITCKILSWGYGALNLFCIAGQLSLFVMYHVTLSIDLCMKLLKNMYKISYDLNSYSISISESKVIWICLFLNYKMSMCIL